jgi:hypothetical protein
MKPKRRRGTEKQNILDLLITKDEKAIKNWNTKIHLKKVATV